MPTAAAVAKLRSERPGSRVACNDRLQSLTSLFRHDEYQYRSGVSPIGQSARELVQGNLMPQHATKTRNADKTGSQQPTSNARVLVERPLAESNAERAEALAPSSGNTRSLPAPERWPWTPYNQTDAQEAMKAIESCDKTGPFDDELGVYKAILNTKFDERHKLSDKSLYKFLGPSGEDWAHQMASGTEAEALKAMMVAVTSGPGTTGEGTEALEFIAKRTRTLATQERYLSPDGKAWKKIQQGQGDDVVRRVARTCGTWEAYERWMKSKDLDDLLEVGVHLPTLSRMAQLGGVNKLLEVKRDENGDLKEGSFLEMLRGDVSSEEFQSLAESAGVSKMERRRQKSRDVETFCIENLRTIVSDAMY